MKNALTPLSKGWQWRKLGDCVRLINGRAYSQDELLDSGTPVIRIQNLNGGDRWYYSDLNLPDDKYCYRGDLLFAWSASFGPYIWRGDKSIFHYHIWRVVPNECLDKSFAFRLLDWITKRVKSASHGVAMLHMTKAGMEEWPIPLPPLPEQIRIAAILDQADALRTKRRESLAQLDSLTQSIFIEMFGEYQTGKTKWAIETFDAIAKDTKIGIVRNAGEFGTEFNVPYIRMNAIGRSGELFLDSVKRTDVTEVECEEFKLQQGDFLFNTRNSRELVGKTAVFRETGLYVYNNNLMRVRFRSDMEPEYVAAAFQTPYIQQELEQRKAGTTNVFAIYYRELRSLPIPVPPTSLQCEFARKVSSIQKLKATHQAYLNELETLFASLQHRAFRGEL